MALHAGGRVLLACRTLVDPRDLSLKKLLPSMPIMTALALAPSNTSSVLVREVSQVSAVVRPAHAGTSRAGNGSAGVQTIIAGGAAVGVKTGRMQPAQRSPLSAGHGSPSETGSIKVSAGVPRIGHRPPTESPRVSISHATPARRSFEWQTDPSSPSGR